MPCSLIQHRRGHPETGQKPSSCVWWQTATHVFVLLAALLILGLTPAPAQTLFGGIDLSTFSFDITSYHGGVSGNGLGGDALASGTSNGIGWSIGPTNIFSFETVTTGSFTFAALPSPTDNLHVGIGFTVTFNQPVARLLVAVSNDAGLDSINLGLLPTLTQGVSMIGTQVVLDSPAGGLLMFEGINSLTITHTDINGADGFNFAFHAIAVPEPSTYLLLAAGLMSLAAGCARKRALRPAEHSPLRRDGPET